MFHNKQRINKYTNIPKRYKMYNIKKRIIALSLSLALGSSLITGGFFLKKYKDDNYQYNSYVSSNEYDSSINYLDDEIAFEVASGDDDVVKTNKVNTNIILNKSDYNKFQSYINELGSFYKFEDIYEINEALSKYKDNATIEKHSHDITNGTGIIDSNVLYEIVKKNNSDFFSHTDNLEVNFYESIGDSYIKMVCDYICNCINQELAYNTDIDKNVVFCTLYNLKIAKHKLSTANAFYNENGVLSVDAENIQKYQDKNSDIDAFRQVIYHEGMHIIQSACPDQLDNGEIEMGICNKYTDLEVNPLYFSWMLEATAEKEMARALNEQTSTYSAPIGYFDSLILSTILNNDISVSDVQNMCFEKKNGNLYKIFNASSDNEKKEILKMMYSIEIMQSSPTDFYSAYKSKTGIDLISNPDVEENLRLSLRTDILKTLSKEFYKSLSTELLNDNITLETTFYLINVYESDVFVHLFYNEKARIASGVEFFNYYTELQNQFFEAISKSNNIDFDSIVSEFENYSMNVSYNGNIIKNYDLSSLGSEDEKFIENKKNQNYKKGIPNIRSMPDYCKNNGYSK